MARKLLLLAGTMIALVVGVMLFAAFEIHHANINAHVENAVRLNTVKESFGTVFPEQQISSFCHPERGDLVNNETGEPGDDGWPDYFGVDRLANTNDDIDTFPEDDNCLIFQLSRSFKECDNRDPLQKEPCPGGVIYTVSWADKQPNGVVQGEHICPFITVEDGDVFKGSPDGEVSKLLTDNQVPVQRTFCDDENLPELVWNATLTAGSDEYDLWNLDFYVPVCDDKKGSGELQVPKGMSEFVTCVEHEVDLHSALEFEVTDYKAK